MTKEKRHDITHLMAAACSGKGTYLKQFKEGLDIEIEKVKKKGYKGPLRIRNIDGGLFGMHLYITGK